MDQDATTILLICLNYASEAIKTEQLAHVSAGQWRMVAELAQKHGVAPLLYHHLKRLDIVLPDEMAEELKQAYLKNAARNMRLYQELGKLLRPLQEKDIAVIVLKGAYLAEAVYDNIGLRSMADLDLLVRKDDLLRVEQELLALGYKPRDCNRVIAQDNYHFGYKLPGNGLSVEIHWTIFASSHPLQIEIDGLWNRAQSVALAHTPALAMSPEDLLLHLCQHTAKHAYDMRIRMVCDIGEVVRRFGTELDWQGIGTRARQWGIIHAVYVILRLAQELLEVAVPGNWLASLEPAGTDQHYLSLARQQILVADADEAIEGNEHTAQMSGSKSLGNKIAIIRNNLLPSRASMAVRYPAPADSWRIYLYYPVRLKDVLVRHGGTLWRMARRDPETKAYTERTNQVTALRDWLLSK